MTLNAEAGFTPPFPIPGRKPKEFSFRREFGVKTGKQLESSLEEMFKLPNALLQGNRIYRIPIEKTLFPKNKQPQDQIDLVKAELEMLVAGNLSNLGDVESDTYTDIFISGIIEYLALYKLVFGEFPLEEKVKSKILRSVEIKNDWHQSPSPVSVSNYLILTGQPFWSVQQSSDMLEDLEVRLFNGLTDYQNKRTFDIGFARTALAYKVLSEHTA